MVQTTSLFLTTHDRRTVLDGEVFHRVGDEGFHMVGIVSGTVELPKGAVVVGT